MAHSLREQSIGQANGKMVDCVIALVPIVSLLSSCFGRLANRHMSSIEEPKHVTPRVSMRKCAFSCRRPLSRCVRVLIALLGVQQWRNTSSERCGHSAYVHSREAIVVLIITCATVMWQVGQGKQWRAICVAAQAPRRRTAISSRAS
jgi:hypothetical protein